MKRLLIMVVLLTGFPLGASAMTMTELYNICKATDNVSEALCVGTMTGAMGTYALMVMMEKLPSPSYCIAPAGTTTDQHIKIFMKWADENPNQLHKPAVLGIVISYSQAFCGWSKKKEEK